MGVFPYNLFYIKTYLCIMINNTENIQNMLNSNPDYVKRLSKLFEISKTNDVPRFSKKEKKEDETKGLEIDTYKYLTKIFSIKELKELQVRMQSLIEKLQKLRELFYKNDISNKITTITLSKPLLQKVIDLLEKEFSNSEFGISQMREELAMSNAQLHRKIKTLTGLSPGELLRNFRLKKVAQILKQKKGIHISEVAYNVGFNNLSYFAKCFKDLYGISPSMYNNLSSI